MSQIESACDVLIKKELIFKSFDETVQTVHIGFLPPKGRYFREKMSPKGDNCFGLEVSLPKGKSFYHYFFNENFDVPKNNGQSVISPYDPQKRAALVLETQVFCPVEFLNEPKFFCHIKDNIWEVRVITHQNWIKETALIIGSSVYPLSKAFNHKSTTFWIARVELQHTDIKYGIRISGLSQVKYLQNDYSLKSVMSAENAFSLSVNADRQIQEELPDTGVGYQIMPDRFHRIGDKQDILASWGDEPDLYNYFGGNIKGLTAKLPYIAELGAGFIYLNPVFQAKSPHRYDCSDYLSIDSWLGNETDFRDFVKAAHELKIKVVLDISLNHCSVDFFAFQDLLLHQEHSAYRNWFEVVSFPVKVDGGHQYSSWHGYKELPQFNLNEKAVQDYFVKVGQYWPEEFGIDGWRLDVCSELPPDFIEKFVTATRSINPAMLIVAETWQNDAGELASAGVIDGITNFTLYLDAIVPFFEHESFSLSKLAMEILKSQQENSFRTNSLSWNFLSNHDIPRFYSIVKNKAVYELAFSLIYALPGTPVLYYGEEMYMEGLADPENRRCMQFEGMAGDSGLPAMLKILHQIRALYAQVFTYGSLRFPLIADQKKLMVVQRELGNESVYFILNFDAQQHEYTLPDADTVLKSKNINTILALPGYTAQVVYINHGLAEFDLYELNKIIYDHSSDF